MSQAAKAQEPSMEEILASIRRIIADDDANKTAKPPEPAPPRPPPAAAVAPKPVEPRVAAPPPPHPVAPPAPPPPAMMDQDAVDKVMSDPAPAEFKAPEEEVLDLTEAMQAPSFRTIDGGSDVVFSDQPPEPAPEPPRAMTETRRAAAPRPTSFDAGIISQTTASAVDSAFHSLANTVLGQNARTLEDLVKEMLRPMLKSWLDDNLPGLVERIVRAEIERVSRGRN
jgi:cell pole-organizing protein PopZ